MLSYQQFSNGLREVFGFVPMSASSLPRPQAIFSQTTQSEGGRKEFLMMPLRPERFQINVLHNGEPRCPLQVIRLESWRTSGSKSLLEASAPI